jgi:ribosomal protein S18 acetylase RimI-like enzyme
MIEIKAAALGLSASVEPILRALPQWFGIESSVQMYVQHAGQHPTLLAMNSDHGENAPPVGFLTVMKHSPAAAEIYVMGILPACHRKGIGRALVRAAEDHLRAEGIKFLQVKTLSDEHPDEGYKKTRAFYKAMGFTLLEEFPDLWGPLNPCWQLIKKI